MTEGITKPPLSLPDIKNREKILEDWEIAYNARKGEIIEYEEVVKLLDKASSPQMFGKDSSEVPKIPGGFSFGGQQNVFYVVYSHLCGEEAAAEKLRHEREHAAVYNKYGVPVDFGIVMSKLPNGNFHVVPLMSPKFPEDMSLEKRVSISHEANVAVSEKSARDYVAIKKFEQ